jgi:hypothetical protein
MRCLTSGLKQPQLADGLTNKLNRYIPGITSESISSDRKYDRYFKEEAEIAERLKQLPKLLASLESFSEK